MMYGPGHRVELPLISVCPHRPEPHPRFRSVARSARNDAWAAGVSASLSPTMNSTPTVRELCPTA